MPRGAERPDASKTRGGPKAPGAEQPVPEARKISHPARSGLSSPSRSIDAFRRISQASATEKAEAFVPDEKRESLDKLAPSFPVAVETFRIMGELTGLYLELKEKMKELDEKVGETELDKIQYLLGKMGTCQAGPCSCPAAFRPPRTTAPPASSMGLEVWGSPMTWASGPGGHQICT